MTDDDVEQASRLASGNVAALLPEEGRTVEEERLHRNRTWLPHSAYSAASASTGKRRRPHHGQRSEFTDHFWVNPFGHALRPHPRQRPDAGAPRRHGRRGRPSVEPGRVRHPFAGARRAPGVISAAHSHSVYGEDGGPHTRRAARSDHPGCVRVLRRPCAVRPVLRRRARPRRGQAHRAPTGRLQGNHSTKPRSTHRRPLRRGAAWWFITMERSCQAQLLAEAAGTPVLINRNGQTHCGTSRYAFRRLIDFSPCSRASPASSRTSSSEPACARTRPAARRTGVGAANQRTPDRGRTPPPVGLDRRGTRLYAAGRIRAATGRVPPGAHDLSAAALTPPDSRLARTAEAACGQPEAVIGHGYRTWMFGAGLATLDGLMLDMELFYVASAFTTMGSRERSTARTSRCAASSDSSGAPMRPVWHRQPSTRRPMRSRCTRAGCHGRAGRRSRCLCPGGCHVRSGRHAHR